MSTKKTTKSATTNTLPEWLTSPYQAATQNATALAQQPAIGTNTQAALNGIRDTAATSNAAATAGIGTLSGMASGNFGNTALTQAAGGNFLKSNPVAQNGLPTAVSGALDDFRANGGLDTGYIGQSGLNDTANGKYLTADSNPYIRGVAQQGADAAQSRINSQFGAAGRSNGSGLYAQLFGQGIADATNDVYAQNYANERQLQQGAQGTLLSTEQGAREAALGRQYGASGAYFGAENSSAENAASRQAQAYEAERQRQQVAAGGLLNTQLQASGQLPGMLSALMSGDAAAFNAGQYEDKAGLNQLGAYTGLLSQLGAPYGQQNSTQTQQTSGLGATLGTLAQLGGAAGSLFGAGGLSSILGGASGATGALGAVVPAYATTPSAINVWR